MLRSIGKQSGESVWNIQQTEIASFHQNAVWCFANRQKTNLTDHKVADAALHPMAGMVVTPIIHKKINCIQQLIIIINAS